MSILHDLSNAQKWWQEVGQPTYLEAAEIIEREETKAKREANIIERRRDLEEQRYLESLL